MAHSSEKYSQGDDRDREKIGHCVTTQTNYESFENLPPGLSYSLLFCPDQQFFKSRGREDKNRRGNGLLRPHKCFQNEDMKKNSYIM